MCKLKEKLAVKTKHCYNVGDYIARVKKEKQTDDGEVTRVVNRHIKPGHETDYNDWFDRIRNTMRTFPGYKGASVIIPGGDLDARIIIYRFKDQKSADNWEESNERQKLLWEVDKYATQSYSVAKGMETWFELPNTHKSSAAPPKWKMALVLFICATLIGVISRLILSPYLSSSPLFITSPIYSAILVISLTYLIMPPATELLKKWLYKSE